MKQKTMRTMHKCMSLLLIAAMLVTTWQVPVQAETAEPEARVQGAIVDWNVVNEDNPEYGTEGGNDTNDKVYLLSIGEVTNPTYGFCETDSTYSESRYMKASDYAHARGAYTNTNTSRNCWWCLRSPGGNTHEVASVTYRGSVNTV